MGRILRRSHYCVTNSKIGSQRPDSRLLRQEARVYAARLDGADTASLTLQPQRYAYVHVARGEVTLNGMRLRAGDGVKLRNETSLTLTEGKNADVRVFDLRAAKPRGCGNTGRKAQEPIRPAAIFTESPSTAALKKNDKIDCARAVRLARREHSETSEVCDATAIVNEKYKKSQ